MLKKNGLTINEMRCGRAKPLPLNLHMSRDMFTWYLKEHVLEMRQTPTRVHNPPKKPSTRGKTKPLGFQNVGLESKQPRVTRLEYLVVPFGTKKC